MRRLDFYAQRLQRILRATRWCGHSAEYPAAPAVVRPDVVTVPHSAQTVLPI